jgi:uncharacterized protein (TIGR02001 family)
VAPQAPLAVLLLGLVGSACSQTTVSLKVESDFIFRGVSLSDSKPDASLSVDYDGTAGEYAGSSARTVEFDPGQRQAALLAYIGYVRRAESGLAWEVGVSAAAFGTDSQYDYGEVFIGVIARSWTARVYLSPSYFGSGVPSAYVELNGAIPLTSVWSLSAHVGALAPIGSTSPEASRRARFDARLGVNAAIGRWELQLARAGATRDGFHATAYTDRRITWLLSAAYGF